VKQRDRETEGTETGNADHWPQGTESTKNRFQKKQVKPRIGRIDANLPGVLTAKPMIGTDAKYAKKKRGF
jgi:hypothetical protein